MNAKHYYVGINPYGINFTYCSDGWSVRRFDTKEARDAWLAENDRNVDTGNFVAEAISAADAKRIIGNVTWEQYEAWMMPT